MVSSCAACCPVHGEIRIAAQRRETSYAGKAVDREHGGGGALAQIYGRYGNNAQTKRYAHGAPPMVIGD